MVSNNLVIFEVPGNGNEWSSREIGSLLGLLIDGLLILDSKMQIVTFFTHSLSHSDVITNCRIISLIMHIFMFFLVHKYHFVTAIPFFKYCFISNTNHRWLKFFRNKHKRWIRVCVNNIVWVWNLDVLELKCVLLMNLVSRDLQRSPYLLNQTS